MEECSALLLTRQWRDSPSGVSLEFWGKSEHGPTRIRVTNGESVVFARRCDLPAIQDHVPSGVPWRHRPVALETLDGAPAVALYFKQQRAIYDLRDRLRQDGLALYESDVKPSDRYLMERFAWGVITVRGHATRASGILDFHNPQIKSGGEAPALNTCVIDIETTPDAGSVLSIALVAVEDQTVTREDVYMIDPDPPPSAPYHSVPDEKSLLSALSDWLIQVDPDVITGWNVINFDLKVLEQVATRLRLKLPLGRSGLTAHWRKSMAGDDHYTLHVPGRLVLDGIDVLRTATYRFDSFALDNVARQLLGRGKKTDDVAGRRDWIQTMFATDKATLAHYNLEDCRLVWEIAQKTRMVEFALARAELTGLQADRVGGSVAAFDQRYLPLLHRHGFVAPDVGAVTGSAGSPGGYVMDSRPGLYKNVLVLDFKSLYPSIIRTFNVDPLALATSRGSDNPIPGFNDAAFAREHHILPELITELWAARDRAKHQENTPLSTAIKILMNSFYGVMGTPGCRFFDPRLASAITLRGHEVLQASSDWIQKQGFEVIYGDTDSLFVWIGNDADCEIAKTLGRDLAKRLNIWWQDRLRAELELTSHLEMEFETHYLNFLMPAVRGSDAGSKKRYAGQIQSPNAKAPTLVFKGLEAIRTDWSELAKSFQRTLYEMVFNQLPFEDYIRQTVAATRNGENDQDLVLSKRLGRAPADYRPPLPPHVRAALAEDEHRQSKGDTKRFKRGDWVSYVQTIHGPQSTVAMQSIPDRELYVNRQLKPVADAILEFLGTDFESITGPQMGLFE